jgi:hypothetical protein
MLKSDASVVFLWWNGGSYVLLALGVGGRDAHWSSGFYRMVCLFVLYGFINSLGTSRVYE